MVRQVIAGWIYISFVFVLFGCVGSVPIHLTEVRNLPDEVRTKLSIADTRQKVRSILGDPLVDAQSLGVEVYRIAGRDIDIPWAIYPVPLPVPGEKVVGFVLVVYDGNDAVIDLEVENWLSLDSQSHINFRLTASGFQFLNYRGHLEPDTLLGPSVSWEELARDDIPEGNCSLVLVMGLCPMELVILDEMRIADLPPLRQECELISTRYKYHKRFIQRNIPLGNHRLKVRQEPMVKGPELETVFNCEDGKTVYAVLDAISVGEWLQRLEGEIAVSKSPPKRLLGIDDLYPILWHAGTWYGPVDGGSDTSTHQ